MTIPAFDKGTKNIAALSTEYTLNATSPIVTPGGYQLWLGVASLANGDTLLVRLKEKITGSGDSQSVITLGSVSNAQGNDGSGWTSPMVMLGEGADFTVEQTAGTPIGNNLKYSIRAVT